MKVSIQYCGQWNYLPKAASLAEEIEKQFKIKPTLIEGKGGVFDVKLGDSLLYSKHETGQFPEHDVIINAIRKKSGQ